MSYILSSVDSISLMIMESWAATAVGASTKQGGEVDPTTSAHKNHQLGRAESCGGTAGVGSVFAGCWHAGVPMHVCSSNIAHTTLCCQETWEELRGERRHHDGHSNLEKVKRLRDLQGHQGSRGEGMV